jgi:dephospho-CoA kinase
LNALVHPAVGKDFDRWALKQNNIYCIKEAALLFESGSYRELDKTILVIAETQKRIDRVVARDGFSREEVLSRMDKQMPQEIKLKMADYIIDNNGDIGLVNQVLTIHKTLLTL